MILTALFHAVTAAPALLLPNVPLPAAHHNGYPMAPNDPAAGQKLDVFLGPFCEDSKRMWPVLKSLAAHRAGKTDIRVHIFPLPYNLGSFLPAQACVASALTADS